MAGYICCTCGAGFHDPRPHNPDRDHGFGTCPQCRAYIESLIAARPDEDWSAQRRSNLDPRYA